MTAIQLLFLIIAVITLVSALMVVSSRRVMHSALWLVLTLFQVAILIALLGSGFFAVAQVLVYVSAIAVLIIFAVMLTRRVMQDIGPQVNPGWWLPALICLALFGGLVRVILSWDQFDALPLELTAEATSIPAFGAALVSPDAYMIPFEVASVLLLAALIGAIYVAVERKEKNQ